MELALPRAYPAMAREQALWQLGRDMADGSFSSLVGTCEVALRLTGVEPRVEVSANMPGACERRIRW